MPTDNPRFSITVDPELDNNIETYWHNTRAKSKTQAVVSLIEKGLANLNNEQTKKSPAPEGAEDREQGIDTMEFELRSMLLRLGLMPANGDLTAEQVEFLAHIIALIQAYFKK